MYGYKAFDLDLNCRDFQFKVGKTYKIKGELRICENGFHFCKIIDNVYNYYNDRENSRICLVRGIGKFIEDGDKVCFEEIEIIKELSKDDIKNTLIKNNSGRYNSGRHNSGNFNSGYYNSGDYNSGYFNNTNSKVRLFNKNTDIEFNSEIIDKLNNILYKVKPLLTYVSKDQMTEQELKDNPSANTTGGFLRNEGKQSWVNVTKEDFEFIKSLPNFDANVFKELTGVDLNVPKTIKITHGGSEFEIDIEKAKQLGIIKE